MLKLSSSHLSCFQPALTCRTFFRKQFKTIKTEGQQRFQTSVSKKDLQVNPDLDLVLSHFNAPIRFACGYGSGVFKQLGYDSENLPQVDIIFGVTHPHHWHSQNFKQNSHHYSSMRYLGSGFVSYVQEKFGAGIYYNPYCEIAGLKVKYGVISIEKLVGDLVHWDTLYLAGRMQKPLKILKDDPHVKIANQINRSHAIRASLLMLPEKFDIEELFMALVGISYMGDFRMAFGENPNKVANIVKAQRRFLEEIYNPVIDAFPNLIRTNNVVSQELDKLAVESTIRKLPLNFRKILEHEYRIGSKIMFNGEVEYTRGPELKQATARALTRIVQDTAITQSIKGLFTAGFTRSISYVGEKISKRFK